MMLLYDLFGRLYDARVFSKLIHDQVIYQKPVVGILYGYTIFLAISFRVIDVRYSEFLIIGLLYSAQCYWGFLYLKYSGLFSESYQVYSTAGILLRSCVTG